MRLPWNRLEKELTLSISTPQAMTQFAQMRREHAAFAIATSPHDLVTHLLNTEVPLEEKDALHGVLVRIIQGGTPYADVAWPVLWLALWPGLSSIYRRSRVVSWEQEEVIAEISAAFAKVVAAVRVDRVSCLTAALVWNTRRRVAWRAGRARKDALRREPLPADDAVEGRETPFHVEPASTPVEVPAWLAGNRDGALVWGVIVDEYTQAEMAERLGLTHDAVRKRYQRALARLRTKAVPLRPRASACL